MEWHKLPDRQLLVLIHEIHEFIRAQITNKLDRHKSQQLGLTRVSDRGLTVESIAASFLTASPAFLTDSCSTFNENSLIGQRDGSSRKMNSLKDELSQDRAARFQAMGIG